MHIIGHIFLNDVRGREKFSLEGTIETALSKAVQADCICFFDDGAFSGKQVIGIFQELMGIPIEERTTKEHHVDELSESDKEKLKNIRVVLSYLYFNKKSEQYILDELKKIGIEKASICYNNDLSEKLFVDKVFFVKDEEKQVVEKYMRIAGQEILTSTKRLADGNYKERWNKERVETSVLGYNDAQQMVVFYNNIPTYSLTPFWANGKVLGKEWIGLFQRTDKG